MSTPLTDFYDALRSVLGDLDATVRVYEDDSLLKGLRTVIGCGKLSGYTLTSDRLGITPEIPTDGSGDPNKFALLLYHTALLFVGPTPDRFSFRTRAYSESSGSVREFIFKLEEMIHELESGSAFGSWQMFEGWYAALAGRSLWEGLTEVTTEQPMNEISVGISGVQG